MPKPTNSKMIEIIGITKSIQEDSNHNNFGENPYGLFVDSFFLYHSIQNPKIEFKVQHRKLVSRPSNSKMIHIVGIIKQG